MRGFILLSDILRWILFPAIQSQPTTERSLDMKRLPAILSVIAVLGVAASAAAATESTKKALPLGYRALSTAELETLAPYLEIVDGRMANLTVAHFEPDGTAVVWMSGGGGKREMYGRWRTMKGGRLCLKVPVITRGRELCPRIVVKGNSFKALGKDGKSISYLIVEFPPESGPRDLLEALSQAR